MKKSAGFTLVEVLITTIILTVSILSALSLFTHSLSLAEGDRELDVAQYEAEDQMEEICVLNYANKRINFTNAGAFRERPMDATNNLNTGGIILNITNFLNRSGAIYANELAGAANGLMRVKVVVCYRQKNRIIGEDTNFNGILEAGEDANGNGELDSPCTLETVVANTT